MDQQVLSNFKKLYTIALFQKCFEVIENASLTLIEFWNDHFNILICLTSLIKPHQSKKNVSLGKSMGLDVDGADLDKLVEEHSEELTTDEFKELHKEQQQEVVEKLSLEEEGTEDEAFSSSKIEEVKTLKKITLIKQRVGTQ
ncbi:hypothetical protein X975_21896, partial [Stegodyphus mimosarum]